MPEMRVGRSVNKTIADLNEEALWEAYPNGAPTRDFFKVGDKVKIICKAQDFNFFFGETGVVTANTHEYLGICVRFDNPRRFENGSEQKDFNFEPGDLVKIEQVNTACDGLAKGDTGMTPEQEREFLTLIRDMRPEVAWDVATYIGKALRSQRNELASLRSRLALLEGLLREAKPYIHDFPLMDDCGGHCKVCDAARELHSRIAAAIEQKGEHPLPEEQKEKTP